MANLSLEQAIVKAKLHTNKGEISEARNIYLAVLQAFPKNKRAQKGLFALKKLQSTKLPLVPSQQIINQILNLCNQEQYEEAIGQAKALLKQYPNAFAVWNILGAANNGLGRTLDAATAFKKVTELDPSFVLGHINLGSIFEAQGNVMEASASYKKALSINPDSPEANYSMGNAHMAQFKLDEAIVFYNKAVILKPDFIQSYINMGNALYHQGKLDEAIITYKKAISFKPDSIGAYFNMASSLHKQGKLDEAIEVYKKVLLLKPKYAEAYNNMGNSLRAQGKLVEAIESFSEAISAKINYADAYNNMGNTLLDQGKKIEGIISYTKAFSADPDSLEALYNLGLALKNTEFFKSNLAIQNAITSILSHKILARPKDISNAAISLLIHEPAIKDLFRTHSTGNLSVLLDKIICNLSNLPLLLKIMSVCPLNNLELEAALKSIRSNILLSIEKITLNPSSLRFQSALAMQCFTNEYIYNLNTYETKILQNLENSIEDTFSKNKQPDASQVLCLASFRALNQYQWCDKLIVTDDTKEVIEQQIAEPQEEENIKKEIQFLEKISDQVSSKVRKQYEENPYPRWINLSLNRKPDTIIEVVEKVGIKLHNSSIKKTKTPNILIAGCGTGQHAIGTASRFKNSNILAIDLSFSSLAYAKRKTKELAIHNIEYMQADILHLHKLDKKFDIIESGGVLHHMSDPMVGWQILVDCLKSGGLMKIGLYSELARQHIVEIREEIRQSADTKTDASIKLFRENIISSTNHNHIKIRESIDFYSLSEVRDLLFHVQEHRFTIPQINDCLNKLGLKFSGFEAPEIIQDFELKHQEKDSIYNLELWNKFEKDNPNVFGGMYQFWCQKLH